MLLRIYIFRPVFGRHCPKSEAVRPPNLPANHLLSTAGFVLFCRIFGRLATVFLRSRILRRAEFSRIFCWCFSGKRSTLGTILEADHVRGFSKCSSENITELEQPHFSGQSARSTYHRVVCQIHLPWKWRSVGLLLWNFSTTQEQAVLRKILLLGTLQGRSVSGRTTFLNIAV
jgi:hypothetical protein